MDDYQLICLRDRPELIDTFAEWFHEKWGVPLNAYQESMGRCIDHTSAIPRWYGVFCHDMMIAGLGIIENDFHDRKDLTPNVCAVFVEEKYRRHGIAGKMLKLACADMKKLGIDTLYLLTDHTDFYERYGWKFLCMAQGDGETHMSRVYIHQEVG